MNYKFNLLLISELIQININYDTIFKTFSTENTFYTCQKYLKKTAGNSKILKNKQINPHTYYIGAGSLPVY